MQTPLETPADAGTTLEEGNETSEYLESLGLGGGEQSGSETPDDNAPITKAELASALEDIKKSIADESHSRKSEMGRIRKQERRNPYQPAQELADDDSGDTEEVVRKRREWEEKQAIANEIRSIRRSHQIKEELGTDIKTAETIFELENFGDDEDFDTAQRMRTEIQDRARQERNDNLRRQQAQSRANTDSSGGGGVTSTHSTSYRDIAKAIIDQGKDVSAEAMKYRNVTKNRKDAEGILDAHEALMREGYQPPKTE